MQRRLPSVFGVSMVVAMMGLMAIAVTCTQAASLFLVESNLGVKSAIQAGDVLDALAEEGQLLAEIGVEVECEEAEGSGLIESSSKASANITFVGCSVTEGNETCAIGESEVPASTKAKLDGSAYAKFVPFETALQERKSEDRPFADVTFEGVGGEECLLIGAGKTKETVEVTGEEAGDPNDNPGAGTGESLVFSEAISEASGVAGLFVFFGAGITSATTDGEVSQVSVLRPAGTKIGLLATH